MRTLKFAAVLTFLCLMSINSIAQEYRLKGGFNLASILDKDNDGTYTKQYDNNLGVHLGLTYNFLINRNFAIEPGAMVIKKGTQFNEDYFGASIEYKMNINYIEVPLNFKLLLPLLEENKNFYLSAGPYLSYAISGKYKAKFDDNGDIEKDDVAINIGTDKDDDEIKPMDMGLTFGLGFDLEDITIGAAYDLGLSNIVTDTANGQTVKNRAFIVSLGIKL